MDVPSMIDYVKMWGGMPSGVHIQYLVRLVSLTSNMGLIDKPVFAAFSGLKYTASKDMPTHFITAAMVATATAEDDDMKPLTTGEIKSLVMDKLNEKVYQANSIFIRLFLLFKDEVDQAKMVLLIRLMRDVVFLIVGRKEKADNTIDDLVKSFSVAVESKKEKEKAPAETATSKDDVPILYNDDGTSSATGKHTLTTKGYALNQTVGVKRKPNAEQDESRFRIVMIEDCGAAHLMPLNMDGTTETDVSIRVSLDDMVSSYKPMLSGFEVDSHYPAQDPFNSNDVHVGAVRAMILLGMEEMVHTHKPPNVRIMIKPSKCVQAVVKHECEHIVIVPATLQIGETDEQAAKAENHSQNLNVVGVEPAIQGQPKFYLKNHGRKEWRVPFWSLNCSDDKAKCNMTLKPFVVTVKRAVPKDSKRANPNIEITFQVAVNFKTVEANETLVLHTPGRTEKKGKESNGIKIDLRPAKKAKTQ
jgi:hypothetical protein